MLSKEELDEFVKKRLGELVTKGEKFTVIAGFRDYFGDATLTACTRCKVPVFVRPWIFEHAIEHSINIICVCCADPQNLKGQLAVDFAKIEQKMRRR